MISWQVGGSLGNDNQVAIERRSAKEQGRPWTVYKMAERETLFTGTPNDDIIFTLTTEKWPDWYVYMQDIGVGNVRGWEGHPGDQGIFIAKNIGYSKFLISTRKWPNWYLYMQNDSKGNIRGWKGDPGPQGHWHIEYNGDGTFTLLTTDKWKDWFMYMQSDSVGNVRGWKGDPGPQGHFKVEVEVVCQARPETFTGTPKGDIIFTLTTEKWPDWYVYMQDNGVGNVRGWGSHPGDSGIFIAKNIGYSKFLISTRKWPKWYLYMQDNSDGNVRGWKGDPGPQGHWHIEYTGDGTFTLTTDKWRGWFMYMQDNGNGNVRGWNGDPGPQGHFKAQLCSSSS